MNSFMHITSGRQCWAAAGVPRHRHNQAYMAVVLSGSYEECGSRGRFRAGPGDVLVHEAFDAHLDRFQRKGAQILNLILINAVPSFSIGRVTDPDAIARAAELNLFEAVALAREHLCEVHVTTQDWPDILAADILRDPDCRLDRWAQSHGLAAETISRGFGKLFGVTPASFRAEVRASKSDSPLVSVAATTGFADQAHMSRATRELIGSSPSWWRKSNPFKTSRG